MAVNTTNTQLLYSTTSEGTFTKLCDIISYPDMGSTPSKLDTTDLSATVIKTSIFGLQETPDLTFECNYDKDAFETINSLDDLNYNFRLTFGTVDGMFEWKGQVKVYANGGGVDEVRKMTVVCSASTFIEFKKSSTT